MELLSSAAPAIFDTACLELWGRWGFKGLGGTICLCRLTQQSFKGTCCCFFWNLLLVCCCLLLVWDKEALGGGSRGRRSFLSKCLHSYVGWQSMDQLVFDDDDDDQECGASVSPPPRSTGEPSDKNWFLLFAELSQPTQHLSLIVSPKTAIWGEKLRNLPLIYDSWLACGAPVTTRGASPGCGCFFGHCLTLPCKDHFESPVISTIPKCQGHIGKVRKSVTIAFIIHHTKESWKHTRNAFNVNNAII